MSISDRVQEQAESVDHIDNSYILSNTLPQALDQFTQALKEDKGIRAVYWELHGTDNQFMIYASRSAIGIIMQAWCDFEASYEIGNNNLTIYNSSFAKRHQVFVTTLADKVAIPISQYERLL